LNKPKDVNIFEDYAMRWICRIFAGDV